jgi:hypothetical protein
MEAIADSFNQKVVTRRLDPEGGRWMRKMTKVAESNTQGFENTRFATKNEHP